LEIATALEIVNVMIKMLIADAMMTSTSVTADECIFKERHLLRSVM
jgi:hypothetical protein